MFRILCYFLFPTGFRFVAPRASEPFSCCYFSSMPYTYWNNHCPAPPHLHPFAGATALLPSPCHHVLFLLFHSPATVSFHTQTYLSVFPTYPVPGMCLAGFHLWLLRFHSFCTFPGHSSATTHCPFFPHCTTHCYWEGQFCTWVSQTTYLPTSQFLHATCTIAPVPGDLLLPASACHLPVNTTQRTFYAT